MRRSLKWTTLEEQREVARLVLVHRCLRNQAPIELCRLFRKNSDACDRDTRSNNKLFMENISTECGRKSFQFQVSVSWNALPQHLRDANSVTLIKSHFD